MRAVPVWVWLPGSAEPVLPCHCACPYLSTRISVVFSRAGKRACMQAFGVVL